ncbi:MAG: FAD-dependent oxidoreductase [Actinobacteria bacterium]|nr:FAD-dependent oxidoreductase [Actinomycetota bacterium]
MAPVGPGAIVVVGAGLAAASAVGELRRREFDGRIVLIGEEPLPPYERPPLSKEYLRGERDLGSVLVRPASWYGEQGVETRFGTRAVALDVRSREVVLADGERVEFDRALVATGARNRRLPIPGLDLDGVLDLRTAPDADRIREAAGRGSRACVVGMGFIGAEVAASLRTMGLDVAALDVFGVPLERALGPEVGRAIDSLHREHGVELHMGSPVAAIEGTGGRARAVTNERGDRVACDFVVVGLGVRPNVEPVEGSGIEVDDGILVDAHLETTAPGVFAAGDVARHRHPLFGPVRVEHYDNAIRMGVAAAAGILGEREPFADPHWFWSDQYEANLQVVGVASEWDRLVIRGSVEERSFVAFSLSAGRLVMAAGVNRGRDVRRAKKLIGREADAEALADEGTDLRELAGV